MFFKIFLIVLVLLSINSYSTGHTAYTQDLNFFASQLESRHPNPYAKTPRNVFLGAVEKELSFGLPTKDSLLLSLIHLNSLIGDSHTGILFSSSDEFSSLPFFVHRINSQLFLVGAPKKFSHLIGAEIGEINGLRTNEFLNELNLFVNFENKMVNWTTTESWIRDPKILNLLGLGSMNSVSLRLGFGEGSFEMKIDRNVFSDEVVSVRPGFRLPPWREKPRSVHYWYHFFNSKKVLYIQYNRCREQPGYPFSEFVNNIWTDLGEGKEFPDSLVIDLRRNGGGSDRVLNPLLKKIWSDSRKFKKIYVMISRYTFSSALFNAIFLKKEFSAILIGEATGGAPSHFGEVKFFELPDSKIQIYHSTKFFRDDEIQTDSLYPDISIDILPEENARGVDPVLNWILDQQ